MVVVVSVSLRRQASKEGRREKTKEGRKEGRKEGKKGGRRQRDQLLDEPFSSCCGCCAPTTLPTH